MKIILFSRAQIAHTPEEIRQLIGTIGAFGFDYAVNEEFAPLVRQATGTALPPERIYGRYIGKQPAETVMVCYGGDGTLLEGVHRLCGAPIPVMGINRARCCASRANSPGSPNRSWRSTNSPCSATARE